MTNHFNNYPKHLFLIDGIGAILSACLLGIIIPQLEPYFGIPQNTLYFLAIFPILFAAYDLFSYWKIEQNIYLNLKGIAGLNAGYCLISIGVIVSHFNSITRLGFIYLILEIIIILFLVALEWKTANQLTK